MLVYLPKIEGWIDALSRAGQLIFPLISSRSRIFRKDDLKQTSLLKDLSNANLYFFDMRQIPHNTNNILFLFCKVLWPLFLVQKYTEANFI